MASERAIGLDIGGTLCKLAIFIPTSAAEQTTTMRSPHREDEQSILRNVLVAFGIQLNDDEQKDLLAKQQHSLSTHAPLRVRSGLVFFYSFPSLELKRIREDASAVNLLNNRVELHATGGGAHKFEQDLIAITSAKGVAHVGELQALYEGLDIILQLGDADEVFVCVDVRFAGMIGGERLHLSTAPLQPRLVLNDPSAEGFLVANIGSGVSFVDCDARGNHNRVGGSSLGGATFLGLIKLLCGGETSWTDALKLASAGDSTLVDLLVGDIYSDAASTNKKLEDLGLRPSTLAASFGKMATSKAARNLVKREDLALATMIMVCLNVAAMAYLHASLFKRNVILFWFVCCMSVFLKVKRKANVPFLVGVLWVPPRENAII